MSTLKPSRTAFAVSVLSMAMFGCNQQPNGLIKTQLDVPFKPPPPLVDMVTNGDLEASNSYPWVGLGGVVSWTDAEAHKGRGSLWVSRRFAGWHGAALPLGALTKGRKFKAQLYAKLPSSSKSQLVSLEIHRVAEGASIIESLGRLTVQPGQWTLLEGEFNQTAGSEAGEVVLAVIPDDPNTDFHVDDVALTDTGPMNLDAESKKAAKHNYALNGGAEDGLVHWTGLGAVVRLNDQHHYEGEYSIEVAERQASWAGPAMRFETLNDAADYVVSIYVRLAEGSSPTLAKLTLKRATITDEEYLSVAQADLIPGAWVKLTGTYRHINASQLEDIFAYVEAASAEANFCVDNFSVTAVR